MALETGPRAETLPSNVEIVRTGEGTFRLVWGRHNIPQAPTDLGSRVGGVILETGMRNADDLSFGTSDGPHDQYGLLLERIKREKIPFYSVDVSHNSNAALLYAAADFGVTLGAASLGMKGLYDLYLKEKKQMSRRRFLKLGVGAALGYVAINSGSVIAASATENPDLKRAGSVIREHTSVAGPYVTTLRNIVAAHKMARISKEDSAHLRGKELAAVYGDMHVGIEPLLRMSSDERLEKLKEVLTVIPHSTNTAQDLAVIYRITPKEGARERNVFFPQLTEGWEVSVTFDEDILRVAREAGFPEAEDGSSRIAEAAL